MSTQHEEKNKKATFPSNEKFQIFKHALPSVATIGEKKTTTHPTALAFIQSIQNFLSNFLRLVNIMGCTKSSFSLGFPILYAICYHGRTWSQDQTTKRCAHLEDIGDAGRMLVHPSRWSTATEVECLVILRGIWQLERSPEI